MGEIEQEKQSTLCRDIVRKSQALLTSCMAGVGDVLGPITGSLCMTASLNPFLFVSPQLHSENCRKPFRILEKETERRRKKNKDLQGGFLCFTIGFIGHLLHILVEFHSHFVFMVLFYNRHRITEAPVSGTV